MVGNIICFLLFITSLVHAQHLTVNDRKAAVIEQANKMADALLKKDIKTFITYTHPRIIEEMGGENKMIDELEKGLNSGEVNFQSITVGAPSKFIKTKNELQCTMPKTIVMIVNNGTATVTSSLIATSSNDGKDWKFIDGGTQTLKTLRKYIPTLSPKLVLLPPSEPVFTKDK